MTARTKGTKPVYRYVRPRTIYYAAALALVSGLMAWGLATRAPLVFDVLRDRNPTFVRLHDGAIRDGYTLKLANRSFQSHVFDITVTGLPGASLKTPGAAPTTGALHLTVEPNQVGALRVLLTAPASLDGKSSQPITFHVRDGAATAETASVFLSGEANPS